MGWDFHFFRTKKIGELLKDENIKEEHIKDNQFKDKRIYLYTMYEGKRSGFVIGNLKENYRDDYLSYAYSPYGHGSLYFVWYLYKNHGIMFYDDVQDLMFFEYCENDKEEDILMNYICAEQMYHIYNDIIENKEELSELKTLYEEGKETYDKLYKRWLCEDTSKVQQEPIQEEVKDIPNNKINDDDGMPF